MLINNLYGGIKMNDKESFIRKNIEQRTERKILPEEIWKDNPIYSIINAYAETIILNECKNTKYNDSVRFFFLIDKQINALSMDIEGIRVICMTTGTVELVPHLVYKMSQCKNFFKEYGSDMNPDEIVKELTSYIFLHIFLHECGHVFEGHIQYLNANILDAECLTYSRINHIQNKVSMDEKTLEYAADLYGTMYLAELFLTNCLSKREVLDKIRNMYAALIFLYLILAVFSKDKGVDEVCVPITSRISEMLIKVLDEVTVFNIEVGDIHTILQEIYPAITIALYRITKLKSKDLVDYQDKNLLIEMEKIDSHWNEIKEKVLKFSIWED